MFLRCPKRQKRVLPLQSNSSDDPKSIYEFKVKDLDRNEVCLEQFRGKAAIVVNVASYCSLTSLNYSQLNELYSKYQDQGLKILAFPCNQFIYQEPGCEVDIKEFLRKKKVNFDVFNKIKVNGKDTEPLFKYLKKSTGGVFSDTVKWNFTKFLVDADGKPIRRYAPVVRLNDIEKDLKLLLDKSPLEISGMPETEQ